MGRGHPTNEQWARLEPLLPKGRKSGRPPKGSKQRQPIDGIRWQTRTGAPCLPATEKLCGSILVRPVRRG